MSRKIDITIPRSMTIAPQNYENIKPSISFMIKDVPLEKIDDVYAHLSEIVDNLFKIRITNDYITYKEIKDSGIDNYTTNLVKNDLDEIQKNIDTSLEKLSSILKEEKF